MPGRNSAATRRNGKQKLKDMEDLFSTSLAVNERNVAYHVVFDNERYVFSPEAGNGELPSFSFQRGHDEWLGEDDLPPGLRDQAIEALETYLLRQH